MGVVDGVGIYIHNSHVGLSVARFDELGNAKAFRLWNEQQACSTSFFCMSFPNFIMCRSRSKERPFKSQNIMDEKMKKNEELQSRRDFFKKAAKATLPILGAVVLANVPAISQAAEEAPMGCNYLCANTCYTACKGGCSNNCKSACHYNCTNNCWHGSKNV